MIQLWEAESELALKAVSIAGERLLDRPDSLSLSTKGSERDIVTEMDVLLEGIIRENLKNTKYSVVGEECGGKFDRHSETPTWCIDPIDGTVNFANRLPFYAVSVGLVQKNNFLLGAVSAPSSKELFFNFGLEKSYLNGKKLKVNDQKLNQSLVAMSFSGSSAINKSQDFDVFQTINEQSRGVLRTGSSALNICYVACERLQAAFGFSNKIWDIAGAVAIARAAGAEIRVEYIDNTNCKYLVAAPGVFSSLNKIFVNKGLF